jgi:hypothetical protein
MLSSVQCKVLKNTVQNGRNVSCSERARRCLLASPRTRVHKRGTEVVRRASGLTFYASEGLRILGCTVRTGTDRRAQLVVTTSTLSTSGKRGWTWRSPGAA